VERLPRAAVWSGIAGTCLVHVLGVAALLVSVRPAPRLLPPTYAVQLVAAAPVSGMSRPAPEAPAKSAPKAAPKPVPQVTRKPAASAKAPLKPAARTAGPAVPLPHETPTGGSDIANVNLQGKQFPYPEYLRNLVTQIYRRWNRPEGNSALTAEVGFVILRDGTVRDIRLLSTSRSYSFDLEAQGAVEAAAAAKAFGALPAGYPADYLQISFSFTPRQLP
jgi:outer membrane biosynthesis protein TonB